MSGVRRLTEKIGRGVREGQLPSSSCIGGGLDLPIYRRPARLSNESQASVDSLPAPTCPSTLDDGTHLGRFGRLPSDRPKVPIVLFEMPELGTMLRSPAPTLRVEALVERSCPACYKYSSNPPFFLGSLSFLPIAFSYS
jgi:hypothetical protein